MAKKKKTIPKTPDTENVKPTNRQQKDDEKHDWFIEGSQTVLDFIEKHRKQVLSGIIAFIVVFIIGIGIYLYNGYLKRKVSDEYFDISEKFTKLNTVKETEKENKKKSVEDGYRKIALGSYPESNLSQFNLGMLFFSNGEYEKAILYFRKASKSDVFGFQASFNLAHSFFNRGFLYQQEKKFDTARENYKTAFITYKNIEKDFPQSPVIPLSYRYRGLTQEYIAKSSQELNQIGEAKSALEKSIKEYQTLLNYAIKHKNKYNFSSKLKEEAEVAIRRVEIELDQLKKSQ